MTESNSFIGDRDDVSPRIVAPSTPMNRGCSSACNDWLVSCPEKHGKTK